MFRRFSRCCFALVATLGVAIPVPAYAEIHALIMTIGNYKTPGALPLKGVERDTGNARAIARRLGVKDANMIFLRDDQLTLEGIRAAFNTLNERIAQNDQVFIYYSGHGGRQRVIDPVERCAESLITVDGHGYIDADLEDNLQTLSRKAEKLIVFLDACHAGGVTTRSAGNSAFTPKYFSRGGADACGTPVNVLKNKLTSATRSIGSGAQNYVFIAAARDDEVALDEPGKGGVATQAWLECLNGAARDLDGSGGLTAEEIRVCAQQRIDDKLRDVQGFSSHHISITGNSNAMLAFAKDAAAPVATSSGTPVSPENTLKDIFSRRDDRRTVKLATPQRSFKIGRDKIEFTLTSSHPGHVYLLMAGSDGNTFDVLFPNRLDRDHKIAAGQTLKLPRENWRIAAGGPAGKNQLLAIVADVPRDFSKLKLTPVGPFSVLDATPATASGIQAAAGAAADTANGDCNNEAARRDLAVAQHCSNAYGAAMVVVEETD